MKKLLTTLLLFTTLLVNATTYYIDPTGNDATGTGAIGAPWKTLFKATSTVTTSGDIIHVKSGTYVETLQSLLSVGVSIEGDGVSSIIKSTLTADWREILKLYSATEGTNGNQHIRNLKFDGQNLSTYWGINIVGRSNVEVDHITMVDFKSNGIFFDGRTDNVALAPAIYSTGNSFHDNIVNNCAAYNLSTGEFGRGALNIGGQLGFLCYNNTITQNQRPDGYNGWPIKYSLNGYNKGLKIYNNTLVKKQFAGTFPGDHGWDFAIELWHCDGGMEIYGNTIQGALDLVQVRKKTYSFGAWIHDNVIAQPYTNANVETGLNFEIGAESVIVENNIFNRLQQSIIIQEEQWIPNPDGWETINKTEDITIRKNLFANQPFGSQACINIAAAAANDTFTLKQFKVYNNTFHSDSANSGASPWVGLYINVGAAVGHIQSVFVQNNIFKGFGDSYLSSTNSVATWDSLILTNNLRYLNANSNNTKILGIAPTLNTNTANIIGNPTFISTTNFGLVTGSPAISAATSLGYGLNIGYTDSVYTPPPPPPEACNSFSAYSLGTSMVLSNSNKTITKATSGEGLTRAVASSSSGLVSWKIIIDSVDATYSFYESVGIADATASLSLQPGSDTHSYAFMQNGVMKTNNSDNSTFGGNPAYSFTTGDTIMLLLNNTAHTLQFAKKSIGATSYTLLHSFSGIPATTWYPCVGAWNTGFKLIANFAPTDTVVGYSPICATITDATPPTVTSTNPTSGATGFAVTGNVLITFSEALNNATVTTGTASIAGVTSGVSYSGGTITINPTSDFAYSTTYTVTITTGVQDVAGNALASPYIFSFTTAGAPANINPVANAGTDQTTLLSSVTLTGSGTDADGTVTGYAWTQVSGGTCTIVSPSSATTAVNSMAVGVYVFRLTVTDNVGATHSDDITITVTSSGRYIKKNYLNL